MSEKELAFQSLIGKVQLEISLEVFVLTAHEFQSLIGKVQLYYLFETMADARKVSIPHRKGTTGEGGKRVF